MGIKLQLPKLTDLRPRLTVIGIGGAGCNAINNMIAAGLDGVDFVVANTDAQSLAASSAEHRLQLGATITEGLGAGARPEIGQAAAEEAIEEIRAQVSGAHMVFIAAGMGGGTGTGAAAVIARCAREMGILTVGVVTKPFQFEGTRRMRVAEAGIAELRRHVDTLIVIPNQNLFRIANEKTSFAEAFVLADQVLYSGVACIVDLIIKEGLINLDFADVRAVLANMGTAMMGTGEAEGPERAALAAEEAISNPLLDDVSLGGAKGVLLSITGGPEMTLYEVDEAASRVRQEVDSDANIIVGATFDESLGEAIRVSIVASGMQRAGEEALAPETAHGAGNAPAWPNNPPPVQAPHVQSYSYTHQPPQPPPHLSSLMSGGGYQASFDDAEGAGTQGAAPAYGALGKPYPPAAGGDRTGASSSRPADGAAQASSGMQPWRGPGDVVIEEGHVHIPGGSPMHGAHAGQRGETSGYGDPAYRPTDADAGNPGFTPAPPAEGPRRVPRMPDVKDFPAVGQREYYAKKTAGADGRSGSESEAGDARRGGKARGEKRLGIFGRLSALAGRHGGDESYSEGDSRRQRRAGRSDVTNGDANEPESRRAGSETGESDGSQGSELPVFFGRG